MRAERIYAAFVLGVFLAEIIALGVLAVAIIGHSGGPDGPGIIARSLLATLAVTVAGIAALTITALATEAAEARRLRHRRDAVPEWRDRWLDVLYADGSSLPASLPEAAIDAYLGLRERLTGEEERHLVALGEEHGVTATLLEWLASPKMARRAEALEALAKARMSSAAIPLLDTLCTGPLSLRPMAARAIARTLAGMPAGPRRAELGRDVARGLVASSLSRGVMEEKLLLLEDAAAEVLAELLLPGAPARSRAAAIGAVGSLRVVELGPHLVPAVVDADADLRVTALRALAQLAVPVPGCTPAVLAGMDADDEAERVAACRAAAHLPHEETADALWRRLADRRWPVRLAAGEALASSGPDGTALLARAAEVHADRFARDMAVQVMHDAGAVAALRVAA